MFLFSGTFFPLSVLPVYIRILAEVLLPLTHVTLILRALTLNNLSWSLLYSLVWIALVALGLFVLAINLMRKRLIV